MKEVKDLKQGDVIYYIEGLRIKTLKYLCVHPSYEKCHILIDEHEEPIRATESYLEHILNQEITSQKEAASVLSKKLEKEADYWAAFS